MRTPQGFSVTACRSSLQGAEMQLPELSSEAPRRRVGESPMLHAENRCVATVFVHFGAELRELRQASTVNGRKSVNAEATFLPFSFFVLLLK